MAFLLYKYGYFQNNCIIIIENANTNDVAVFKLTDSPLNIYVNNVNIVIPQTNATNLPGQKLPSNPAIVSLVASINIYVIGTPNTANANYILLIQAII